MSESVSTETTANRIDETTSHLPAESRVEAALVTSDRPIKIARLVEATGLSKDEVRAAVDTLNELYEQTGRVFRILPVADGWQVMTLPEVAPVLARLFAAKQQSHLTQAAMETLAIIAYRQPVLRAEIEAIRGVACGEVLRGLLERRLVRIAGRAEELGRPMLYGTTRDFLRAFGLGGIDDLPDVEGLDRSPSWSPPKAAAKAADEDPSDTDRIEESSQPSDA
ncbi:MAG: SMC-Scp complex subunit ScpB [Planctomycetes bacterium]|nr:SMC-Scp complex subunit ScpB [Planctomycetota bacterium]MCP4839425.1 SMC-Scp complex subunit ScpB [Planctomycetota bacterium]